MKPSERTYKLKSGHLVSIRVPNKSEAFDLITLKRDYIKSTTTLPWTLDEYAIDIDKEAALIADYYNSENSILLVAEYNDKLIGNIDITGSTRKKMHHTAMLGMGIKEEWRNEGLGKILIECVLDWAKQHSELKIIWLDVYASNVLGVNLYKKMGFEVSGVVKDFFLEGHAYIDKIQMYKHL